MHIRGKYQCLELIYPGNPSNVMRRETINCANWDYNWHSVYNYQDQVAPLVPAGTVIHIVSWHDNSAGNRHNPDPKNWVGYGDRTIDEMGFSWIGWIDLTRRGVPEGARRAERGPSEERVVDAGPELVSWLRTRAKPDLRISRGHVTVGFVRRYCSSRSRWA